MAHTQGPWFWKDKAAGIIGSKSESYIAECDDDADARLIIAAPDLLEAADLARRVLEVTVTRNQAEGRALVKCRAAIAKAKGEADVRQQD